MFHSYAYQNQNCLKENIIEQAAGPSKMVPHNQGNHYQPH